MLIVQGGRDYQATVDDDLSRWQAALGTRTNVAIRIYQPGTHLFGPGSSPCPPAGCEPAQHMNPAVVADIAGWLSTSR